MTPATTQVIINVIFERRKAAELGNISKFFKIKKNKKKQKLFFFTSLIHCLIETLYILLLLFINTS